MHVEIQNRPIEYPYEGCPEVHSKGRSYANVPEILYPVMLETEEGELRIGTAGSYQAEGERRWAWYCSVGNQKSFLRSDPTAAAAVRRLIDYARGAHAHIRPHADLRGMSIGRVTGLLHSASWRKRDRAKLGVVQREWIAVWAQYKPPLQAG